MKIAIKHHPFDGSGPVDLWDDVDNVEKAREILRKRQSRMVEKGFDADFLDDNTLEITDRDDAQTTSSHAGKTRIHITYDDESNDERDESDFDAGGEGGEETGDPVPAAEQQANVHVGGGGQQEGT